MNPNSGRFLSQKWIFVVFTTIAFVLIPFVPLVLAEEQTDTPKAGVPTKKAEGAPRFRSRRLYGADARGALALSHCAKRMGADRIEDYRRH
jgi:hypothetical protein